ncbi:DUF4846 domain-containing protein [Leyella stercorea]|uniref:DUF4846 domain-containing protein n=1 Tax=Leyella stercorea TaxID=363265 RepID=UPI00266BDC50|nr:DUF4846 domain-containing protein [Leyella stercorea]
MILVGVVWWYSRTSNPWNAATIGDISTPIGYTRVDGSYAEFMRSLPLKKRGSKVQLYTGGDARFQFLSTGVIDIPMLSNSEQCADMTMRVRAEYLFSQGRYSEIRFQDVNGNTLQYQGGASRKALEKFLKKAYGVCSTFSVSRETKPRPISDVQPGDVLVYPARKLEGMGHALIVIDVARNGKKVAIMCAEGNTPARELHIVRNPNPISNPWFFFDGDESMLFVSIFHFGRNELRHY